jgi:hypothetical protein
MKNKCGYAGAGGKKIQFACDRLTESGITKEAVIESTNRYRLKTG